MKTMGAFALLIGTNFFCVGHISAQDDDQRKVCSGGDKVAIDAALKAAKEGIQKAIDALQASTAENEQRYVTFFGAGSPTDIKAVNNTFKSMATKSIFSTYWCPNVNNLNFAWGPLDYAAVDPAHPTEMFIAPAFFKKPVTGTNTQMGTIVHELAHQGGAHLRPERYGAADVKNLANTDPSTAVQNADNYKYYVEDLLGGVP